MQRRWIIFPLLMNKHKYANHVQKNYLFPSYDKTQICKPCIFPLLMTKHKYANHVQKNYLSSSYDKAQICKRCSEELSFLFLWQSTNMQTMFRRIIFPLLMTKHKYANDVQKNYLSSSYDKAQICKRCSEELSFLFLWQGTNMQTMFRRIILGLVQNLSTTWRIPYNSYSEKSIKIWSR